VTPAVHTGPMITTGAPRGEQQGRGRGSRGSDDTARAVSVSAGWQPLAGAALLDRLRHTGRARPTADPALAADLRSFVAAGFDDTPAGAVASGLVVTKDRLTRALACPSHRVADGSPARPFTVPLACGALVDVLFRQLVTVGTVGDAMVDALDGLALDEHQAPLVAWIGQLAHAERSELRAEVERQSDGLRRRWPALDPSWLPRTRETLRASLAGGRVELVARVDLALGRPAEDEATVAIVEVTSGSRRPGHRDDLHVDALVGALRSSAPPFVVATYYVRTGELDVDPVTPDLLVSAARRCRAGIDAMVSADAGTRPAAFDHPYCAGCAELPLRADRPDRSAPSATVSSVSDPRTAVTEVVLFPQERAA